jgi:hypothetical protein
VGASRPLRADEDAVGPRQEDVYGYVADDIGVVVDLRSVRISGPSVGLEHRTGSDVDAPIAAR